MTSQEVLEELRSLASEKNRAGMARFGIEVSNALGVGVTALRRLARKLGKDHDLARELWDSEIHEARILASIVDVPAEVTEEQMESWVTVFDSWDLCDQACANLFWKTPFAWTKAFEWSAREPEFEKRAGFALMAALAVKDKAASDDDFLQLLPLIEAEADDDRNFVKKAVNWALRQIGKRNLALHGAAIATAEAIAAQGSRSARWIAADALRELRSKKVTSRLT